MASWVLFSSIRERAEASVWSSCRATRFATTESVNMQKTAASLAAAGKHALFDEGAATANPHPFCQERMGISRGRSLIEKCVLAGCRQACGCFLHVHAFSRGEPGRPAGGPDASLCALPYRGKQDPGSHSPT